MTTASSGSKPKDVRQGLSRHEPGAHLYTSFLNHFKGGLASLLPIAILYFTTQPFGDAMATLTMGGYTFGPIFIALYGTGWALMSKAILHKVRFRDDLKVHLLAYGAVGGIVLMVLGLISITLVQGARTGIYDPSTSGAFMQMLLIAPVVGAVGSAFGRWAIDKTIYWHRWIVREPLKDVFGFVEGKRDKDEYKRM